MIEDHGGCFHHFSHLLACPQGDGKEILSFISESSMIETFKKYSANIKRDIQEVFEKQKFTDVIVKIAQCICSNGKIYLPQMLNLFVKQHSIFFLQIA